MKKYIIAFVSCFVVCLIAGLIVIPLLKKLKVGQTILKYVEEHKQKQGTPTMGGLFFIIPSSIIFLLIFGVFARVSVLTVAIGLAFLVVGFIDDFIKIKGGKNEGLKPYQKILFQASISIFAGVFCYLNGMTVFFLPFTNLTIELGFFTVFFVAFIFVAITNSVNLTDGLDGLAGSVSLAFFIMLFALMIVQLSSSKSIYIRIDEHQNLLGLISCLAGGTLAFLCFNMNKAKVFMGDTGSLSLGAFIGALSIFSGNALFIPLLGIMFVSSSISVIMQVLYFKKTKNRVFLKAPLHHHFQLKGYTETQISFAYSVLTLMVGLVSILFYL